MIIYSYLDDRINPATISYPAISDAQIAEASPKSTGSPAALAVVAALALVKPRPRIWEVATTVQPIASYTPRGLLWPALRGYKLQNQPTSN